MYEQIALRLPKPQLEELKTEAKKRGIKTATCARDLITERMNELKKESTTVKERVNETQNKDSGTQ